MEIRSLSPILMDNIALAEGNSMNAEAVKGRKTKYDPKAMAERGLYKAKINGKEQLYIPARALFSCIVNGAKEFKVGKRSLATGLSGSFRIEPEMIGLGTVKYDIDERSIVTMHGRVMKARALIKDWKAKFTITYYKDILKDPEVLEQVLEVCGIKVGILSFRPQCKGWFGTFELVNFKVIS